MHSYGGYYLTLLHHGITHSFLCKLSMKRISYTYIKDRSSAIDRRVIERSQQRSPTQSLKKEAICRRRAIYPTRELAIFVIFFLHCSHPYIFIFNTSIASVGTHERIAKICVSKCPILKFFRTLKIAKIGSIMSFLLLTFQFPRFLNIF